MGAVVFAHETDLDQTATGCHFGVDDAPGIGQGGRHRLFAEDRFASFDTDNGQVGVGGIGRRDQDGVYGGVGDEGGGIGVSACPRCRSQCLSPFLIDIHDGGDFCADRSSCQIFCMHGPHHSGADDANADGLIGHFDHPFFCYHLCVFDWGMNNLDSSNASSTG